MKDEKIHYLRYEKNQFQIQKDQNYITNWLGFYVLTREPPQKKRGYHFENP